MIDFHCHLDLYPEPETIAAGCESRGMHVLSVTTTPSAWDGTSTLANARPQIRTALGLHPQIAHERKTELPLFDELLPKVHYVGEVGLDGSLEFRPHWAAQRAVFDHVLDACSRAGGRILSIHSRRASGPVLDSLEAYDAVGIPVLHWFSGAAGDLDRAIDLGCWFSVGPAMLQGKRGRMLTARMPRDRILTESDGPFARLDDRPVLPWQVTEALRNLAELWSVSPDEAEAITHENLHSLTSLVPAPV